MEQNQNAIVLEVLKQANGLSMSIFEKPELASTIRHYSQCQIPFSEIDKLCLEAGLVINKINKYTDGSIDVNSDLKKVGQLLWDNLLAKAIKDKLKNASNRDLVLFLDEELINIPWELIYDGQEFLCLKFSLGRLVRTKEQPAPLQYRSTGSTLKMLVLANPTADLRSAYLEGLNIKNQFDRKAKEIKIDFKSTRIDTLYVKKNLRDYDIVHFAGHCEYDSADPRQTGWVLADGRFTTQDIISLGESLSLPSLIFSNSCYSAKVGDGRWPYDYQEKTYSLASAFLFSGVRHYIGTIWKIDDPISSIFAKEFYTQLIKGESVGECIRRARLHLNKEYGLRGIAWGSYILYGDPNFALLRKKERLSTAKTRRKISLTKKSLLKVLAAAAIVIIGICLYTLLPTINPSTYLIFAKSNQLLQEGKNQQAIAVAGGIIDKDPAFLAVYPLLADAYARLGDPDNALKYYFDYSRQSQRKQDNKHLAAAYIGIGWLYQGLGNYPKAFEFYNKSIALAKASRDTLNEAIALRKLAVWHIDKEEYDKALELLTKSSELNRERQYLKGYRYNLACDYFDIGLLFTDKNDFAAAQEFYRKSQLLFSKLKLKKELSDYYFNLGEIYLFEKQYQRALDFYLRGLNIDRAQNNKPNLASDYNMLGELYVEMGDLAEAEKCFQQALATCKQIKAPLETANTCYNLGLLYKQKRQKQKSREYFRWAQEIYRKVDTPECQKIKQELLELDSG